LRHFKIELKPFSYELRVYFPRKLKDITKLYPRAEIAPDIDGCFFRVPYKDGDDVHDVIAIQNEGWNNESWINKVGIMVHESIHCVYHLLKDHGVNDEEMTAYYVQYIVSEICRNYDFEENEIKRSGNK